jgi:hypothetical protein
LNDYLSFYLEPDEIATRFYFRRFGKKAAPPALEGAAFLFYCLLGS